MALIKRCCFSRNLKAGSIVAGIWSLVWCVYVLSISVLCLVKFKFEDADTSLRDVKDIVLEVLIWVVLCFSFLTFLTSIIVIFAIFKENKILMIPWAVMVALLTALEASSIITQILVTGFEEGVIAALLVWFIVSLVNIYCELCMISHFQEVDAGRGHRENYVQRSQRNASASLINDGLQAVQYGDIVSSLINSEVAIDGADCDDQEYRYTACYDDPPNGDCTGSSAIHRDGEKVAIENFEDC